MEKKYIFIVSLFSIFLNQNLKTENVVLIPENIISLKTNEILQQLKQNSTFRNKIKDLQKARLNDKKLKNNVK